MPLAFTEDLDRLLHPPNIGDTILIIRKAEEIVRRYCHRHLEQRENIVETFDGSGQQLLRLVEYPVVTDTVTVVEDGTTLVADADFVAYEDGRIYRGHYRRGWPSGRRNIQVTYTGGYDPVPEDITDVVAAIAARIWQAGHAIDAAPDTAQAVKRMSLDGSDSVEYRDVVGDVTLAERLTPDEKHTLNLHRRVVFA